MVLVRHNAVVDSICANRRLWQYTVRLCEVELELFFHNQRRIGPRVRLPLAFPTVSYGCRPETT